MYYLNYFFIFSILGHLFELILIGRSGILYGLWTPIYGIGVILILMINNFIDKFKLRSFKKFISLFFISCLVLSIIESIGGYLIEFIFNKSMWDYTKLTFNIGKYTAIEMALVWGIGSLIFIYLLKPLFDKKINKIPKFITYFLVFLFILDIFVTLIFKH